MTRYHVPTPKDPDYYRRGGSLPSDADPDELAAFNLVCREHADRHRAMDAYTRAARDLSRRVQGYAERTNQPYDEVIRRLHDQERQRQAYSHEAQQRYLAAIQAQAEVRRDLEDRGFLPRSEDRDGRKSTSWAEEMRADAEAREAAREARERIETKAAPLTIAGLPLVEFKMAGTEARFSGYAAAYGPPPDKADDIIEFGAFKEAIQQARDANLPSPSSRRRLWPMLFGHDQKHPIGAIMAAHEDSRGLYVEGLIATDIADGQTAYSLLSKGFAGGLSIGYRTLRATHDAKGTRHITKAALMEVSFVPFPANTRAGVTSMS